MFDRATPKILDFRNSSHPTTSGESTAHMLGVVRSIDKEKKRTQVSKGIDPEAAINQELEPASFSYTHRDVILYALGVGMSTKEDDYLKFLFEMSEDFSVIPSFGVIPSFSAMTSSFGRS